MPKRELIDIAAEVKGETDKAWRLHDGTKTEWVPKSQVEANSDGTFTMPEWLAKGQRIHLMAEAPMTLIERLRNPARFSGGVLNDARTVADMNESANAHEAERAIRRALVGEIKRLSELLKEANEICRSMHSIACRKGAETNWDPFIEQLSRALHHQHEAMYPKTENPSH